MKILKNNINLDCDENLSFTLNIELMRQAISNLIDNAIKYGGLNSNININVVILVCIHWKCRCEFRW